MRLKGGVGRVGFNTATNQTLLGLCGSHKIGLKLIALGHKAYSVIPR